MRKALLFLILAFQFFSKYSQNDFVTKDGYDMGSRKDFIESCSSAADKISIDGMEIESRKYCECMTYNLIPKLTKLEIEIAIEEGSLPSLIMREDIYPSIIDCVERNVSFQDDFQFNSADADENREFSIQACVYELISDNTFTKEESRKYCECAVDKMYENNTTYEELQNIEDEDKEAFNEIILPCIDFLSQNSINHYAPHEIIGRKPQIEIPLIKYGNTFKIKLEIDGITRYFLFDTGASELLIDTELERELFRQKSISHNDYTEGMEFELADGSIIEAQGIRLNNVVIGEYRVNNVVAYIIDEGGMLCGMGMLNKFKKWNFDKEFNTLTLYK